MISHVSPEPLPHATRPKLQHGTVRPWVIKLAQGSGHLWSWVGFMAGQIWAIKAPENPYLDPWHISVAQSNQELDIQGVTRGTRV